MKAGVGYSIHQKADLAGGEAAAKAVEQSGTPAMTLLFTTDHYDQAAVLDAVRNVTGASALAGMCCGGIIVNGRVLTQGVGVFTLGGDDVRAVSSLATRITDDPGKVGRHMAETLLASGLESGTVVLFPDGFSSHISDILRELYNRMGPDYQYIGGGAGDNLKFQRTWQFSEDGLASDALAAMLVQGPDIAMELGHGWQPVGDPLVITRAQGKRVMEMDGIPAFEAYSQRLGGLQEAHFTETGMQHPLGFPDISGHYLIRDPLCIGEDNCIDFITEIPRHGVGSIMVGHVDDLIRCSERTMSQAVKQIAHPRFALLFDCISRYLLMGDRFAQELEVIGRSLGTDVPMLGALTFGEVGCYVGGPLFHNKTLAVAVGGQYATNG